jgi:transketolase
MNTATERSLPVAQASRTDHTGHLEALAKRIRSCILNATTQAGSGHPTSALSATELMTALLFGGTFRYDVTDPHHPNNDRLIFSKGHASPLLYALWVAAGRMNEDDLMTYRQFGSSLEGHPTPAFEFAEAATGSLGQGLSIGLGMALNARFLDQLPYRTYVLIGDSEMAEGSQWEALEIAAHYKLNNLIAVLDVNRLGQRGETMHGHDLEAYERRVSAFGWQTFLIDGHSIPQIVDAYEKAAAVSDRPVMIIAKTIKGKGVSLLEDKDGWHGKALNQDELKQALQELGEIDHSVVGTIPQPEDAKPVRPVPQDAEPLNYPANKPVATRVAYGNALARLYRQYPQIVSLDGEVSNSTHSEKLHEGHPDRFFEMYIAEQNMVGTALGLSRRAKIPFVSTFAAFMTRAFDQIRMAQYSRANIKFVGSHAGVSIGEDGPSQMGLEDIAMFRTLMNSVVLHPADAVATEKLVEEAARHVGIVYLRTMRQKTPILYSNNESFPIGGCKVLRQSRDDLMTIVAAGATVHEALEAYDILRGQGVSIRVIDCYSIKPLDAETLIRAAQETEGLVTVEDHYGPGGLGEAVMSALSVARLPVCSMSVGLLPRSGKPDELREFEEISAKSIVQKVMELHSVVTT